MAVELQHGRSARGLAAEGDHGEDGPRSDVSYLSQARPRDRDGEIGNGQGTVAVGLGAPDEDEEDVSHRNRYVWQPHRARGSSVDQSAGRSD